jgi:hypothetical protein
MKMSDIVSEGDNIDNPKNTFLTKADTAYDFLRVGKTISNLSNAKKSDNRDEPDVMIVPFGGKKEKDHLKKGLKKAGYKTQDADAKGADAHVDETTEMTSASVATSMGGGNGFLNGGIGDKPIKRVTKKKKATKKKA